MSRYQIKDGAGWPTLSKLRCFLDLSRCPSRLPATAVTDRHVALTVAAPLRIAPFGVYAPAVVTGAITHSAAGNATRSTADAVLHASVELLNGGAHDQVRIKKARDGHPDCRDPFNDLCISSS